ncbi:MAG: Mpo1-like protein [Acidobacteriota bacterium]
MKKVDSLLSDYAFYHQTTGNKICHFIGIPLIILSLLALLRSIVVHGWFTAAEILILLSFIYYLMLDFRLAIGMLLAVSALDAAAWKITDIRIGLAVLIIGWIFQGIGHAIYEKRSPAFTRNLVHLMVGPLFLLNEVLRVRPVTPQTGSAGESPA